MVRLARDYGRARIGQIYGGQQAHPARRTGRAAALFYKNQQLLIRGFFFCFFVFLSRFGRARQETFARYAKLEDKSASEEKLGATASSHFPPGGALGGTMADRIAGDLIFF